MTTQRLVRKGKAGGQCKIGGGGNHMIGIIGIAVVFVMVFGGYALYGCHIMVIVEALPTEMMDIFGGACGAMI